MNINEEILGIEDYRPNRTMTRCDDIIAELESEIMNYSPDAQRGISFAISVVKKHLSNPVTKKEIERCGKAIEAGYMQNELGAYCYAKRAIAAFLGAEGKRAREL